MLMFLKNLNFSAETELVNGAGLMFDFIPKSLTTQWIDVLIMI